MKLSESVKPVSFVKAHAAEIIRQISAEGGRPVVITQNGEAKAVIQGVKEYEAMLESLALLKILAMSTKSLDQGQVKPAREAFQNIRRKIQTS